MGGELVEVTSVKTIPSLREGALGMALAAELVTCAGLKLAVRGRSGSPLTREAVPSSPRLSSEACPRSCARRTVEVS